ncbi:MAG: acyltransferase [Methylococcaceae bacterium]
MKKLTQLNTNLPTNFRVGKSSNFRNSWCEIDESDSQFVCGQGSHFTNVAITIHRGAKLSIGDGCIITGRIIVDEGCELSIGHGLRCNFPIKISVSEGSTVRIGNECLFSDTQIWSSDMHSIFDTNSGERINNARDINIANRVWLGSGSIILKGSQLDHDVIVGAHTVVTGSYPSNCAVAGNPARIVREGIEWSRHTLEHKSMRFENDFSPSSLVAAARLFQHDEVIERAIIYLNRYIEMDESNYFVFYYLARAIFEKFFTNGDSSVQVHGIEIRLLQLCEVLEYAWNISGCKNHPCGSYAYLIREMLGDSIKAHKIYKLIEPHFNEIENYRKRIETFKKNGDNSAKVA